MMQPRCAVCDGDNDVMTLCDAHTWLTHVYALVYTGGWSDWPLPDYCEYGPLVSHRQMMTSVGGGSSHGWQAQLAVMRHDTATAAREARRLARDAHG